jgi:Family of unknown function (DUF5309)
LALLIHSGTAAIDLAAAGTIRQDISDLLLASLSNENNLLGSLTVGEEFSSEQLYWVEDTLNPYKVTLTSVIAAGTTGTTFTVSSSDAATLDVGYILEVDASVGVPGQEQYQVITLQGTTVTVTRQFGSTATTGSSVASSTVLRVVNRPTYPNSDLGKDMSRVRISKTNYINRFETNVNIDSEQILFSQQGYIPGVTDELSYQAEQRMIELRREMSQALLYSRAQAANSPLNEYQTMNGLLAWLDGSVNATAAPINAASALFSDQTINTSVTNVFRQGAYSNVLALGPNLTQKVGSIYSDRIRLEQSEMNRGFFAQRWVPSMANTHEIINEVYLNDNTTTALMLILDINRIRIRPLIGMFWYMIQAPSFRDGDAVRILSKWSLEARNTGTDAGYSHQLTYGLSF